MDAQDQEIDAQSSVLDTTPRLMLEPVIKQMSVRSAPAVSVEAADVSHALSTGARVRHSSSFGSEQDLPPEVRVAKLVKQVLQLQDENGKVKQENDRLKDEIHDLEHENEALKTRGKKDAERRDDEILRRDAALGKAGEAIEGARQEVRTLQLAVQDAQDQAEAKEREVARLEAQLAEQETRSQKQADQLHKKALQLEASANRGAALEVDLSKARRDAAVVAAVWGGTPTSRRAEDLARQEAKLGEHKSAVSESKLADLKGVVEPSVLKGVEDMEKSWKLFKRLL